MLVLPMRAPRGNQKPAVIFDAANDLAHLHAANIRFFVSISRFLAVHRALLDLQRMKHCNYVTILFLAMEWRSTKAREMSAT
jgi:hypothetical protein